MFCPRCGELMKETYRTFYCEKGEMDFSENLARQVKERFDNHSERAVIDSNLIPQRRWVCSKCIDARRPYYVDSTADNFCSQCGSESIWLETIWYCPQCGIPIGNDCLKDTCPVCQKDLKALCFQLVELHSHKNENGNWT